MKKTLTLLCALGVSSFLTAQTLTYANFSNSLTSTTNVAVANQSSFNVTLTTITGTGVTWDASGLTQQNGTPLIHAIFGDPSNTPNGSLFPLSNYVLYDPALTSLLSYEYYTINADSLVMEGEYGANTAHEIYQNPDKRLVFPFSYLDSFSDTYAKTNYSDATTISSFQTGSRTVNFSGFGTLILPGGTYNNVALITELRTNSLGPNSNTYTWYNLNSGKRLLLYSSNDGNVTVAYNTDVVSSTSSLNKHNTITLSPNPASESITLHIASEIKLNHHDLRIFDLLGQQQQHVQFEGSMINIKRNELPSGTYFYQLDTNSGQIISGKIIFE